MTERTYDGMTLDEVERFWTGDTIHALIAHIRELQAENAKIKAERREFGLRVATLVAQKFNHNSPVHEAHYAAIVEQELNRAP